MGRPKIRRIGELIDYELAYFSGQERPADCGKFAWLALSFSDEAGHEIMPWCRPGRPAVAVLRAAWEATR